MAEYGRIRIIGGIGSPSIDRGADHPAWCSSRQRLRREAPIDNLRGGVTQRRQGGARHGVDRGALVVGRKPFDDRPGALPAAVRRVGWSGEIGQAMVGRRQTRRTAMLGRRAPAASGAQRARSHRRTHGRPNSRRPCPFRAQSYHQRLGAKAQPCNEADASGITHRRV